MQKSGWQCAFLAAVCAACSATAGAQAPPAAPTKHYEPAPAFDTAAMDKKADPCQDFYQYACGNYATLHPIPSDQSETGQFNQLFDVNTERLNGILIKTAAETTGRTANEQKIGDYYAACMNTDLINQKGLAPVQPLLAEIDRMSKPGLPYLAGELQRMGVNVFFSFGQEQDFKDATQIKALFDQGGLGLPERDYYTRTGDKDKEIRAAYVDHIAKMLTLAGEDPAKAKVQADAILAFETELAKGQMTITEQRDPVKVYNPMTLAAFQQSISPVPIDKFLEAIHAPQVTNIINGSPAYFPVMVKTVLATDTATLKAYMRYQLLSSFASSLPKAFDDENFHFEGTVLYGQPEQQPRWKRCSSSVDGALGEALGQVYVSQFFAGDSKAKTLEMVHDIEAAMDRDIDTLDWMSPETRVKAKEKLHLVANKIGYPDKWRDYSTLAVKPDDALGNRIRATDFENDRQMALIGKPVDKTLWDMTPPTVNAYYNPSMNNINFPAGILQPAFYDPKADLAVNYGHMGEIIGHELTHGFDDQGSQFNGMGNMVDWWTPEDKKHFEEKTGCLVNEYNGFSVGEGKDAVNVNGKLTLGENTADNGGLVLAYSAYLNRAKDEGIDINKKIDGYTGPQRFYIASAQNWCSNIRPETARNRVLTDPHSPDHFRANGVIVNQPSFGAAFGCKKDSPMVPDKNCRVW